MEGFGNGLLILLIHREPGAGPIHRSADFFKLVQNNVAVFFFPFPDFFQKFFPSEIVAADALFFQIFFHHVLSGNARVVGAGQPESFIALHPFLPDDDILNGGIQRVAHVKRAGHVRRWNGNSKSFCSFASLPRSRRWEFIRIKIPRLLPEAVDFFLHLFRIVSGRQLFHIKKYKRFFISFKLSDYHELLSAEYFSFYQEDSGKRQRQSSRRCPC